MPFTSEFADIRFSRCYSPETWTLPSHASIYTQQPVPTHGVTRRGDRLDEEQATLPRNASAAGYRTGMFSENAMFGRATGFHSGIEFADDSIHGKPFPSAFSAEQYVDELTVANAATALRETVVRPPRTRNLLNLAYRAYKHLRPEAPTSHPHHGGRVLSHLSSFVGRNRNRPLFCVVNLLDTHNPHRATPEVVRDKTGCSVSSEEAEAMETIGNTEYLLRGEADLPDSVREVFGS
jgi:arylsulfatase A-like enzyme